MQIAVLGAGNIGGTIGEKWAKAGHTIRFGVRDPQKPEVQSLVKSLGANASAVSIADALQGAEVVLFAIPGGLMTDTIGANADVLDGKILIDATNNLSGGSVNSMAVLAQKAPHSSVYRTFNCYGWENFKDPIPGADLFYAGTDGAAKKTIEQLISEVGLHPLYVGGTDQAALLDSGVLSLWFALAGGQKMGRKLAFKVLTD